MNNYITIYKYTFIIISSPYNYICTYTEDYIYNYTSNYSMIISTLQMSIYPNVTDQDLINVRNLAEQQKNKGTLKIKNRILKQTHDMK